MHGIWTSLLLPTSLPRCTSVDAGTWQNRGPPISRRMYCTPAPRLTGQEDVSMWQWAPPTGLLCTRTASVQHALTSAPCMNGFWRTWITGSFWQNSARRVAQLPGICFPNGYKCSKGSKRAPTPVLTIKILFSNTLARPQSAFQLLKIELVGRQIQHLDLVRVDRKKRVNRGLGAA